MHYPNPMPMFLPMLLWLLAGPHYIHFLKQRTIGQFIREDGPEHHHTKEGTPTMGGVMLLACVFLATGGLLLWQPQLLTMKLGLAMATLLLFGGLGFADDYLKVAKQHNKGVTGWTKLLLQVTLGLIVGWWSIKVAGHSAVSVFGFTTVELGWLYIPFAIFLITGASNAYNLTDGLDGLAAGTGTITFLGFAFLLLVNHPELTIVSLFLAGSCLGFLVFNRYPAQLFMGDTGSLALGGVMGTLAIMGHVESFLALIGIIYVLETLSVMLQVASFKTTGKRIFKMSPLHHHFELCGWKEPFIVIIFTLFQLVISVGAVLLYNMN